MCDTGLLENEKGFQYWVSDDIYNVCIMSIFGLPFVQSSPFAYFHKDVKNL